MKRTIILALGASLALGAYAGDKLDAGSRARLRAGKAPVEISNPTDGKARVRARVQTAEETRLHAFLTVTDAAAARGALEKAGATVASCRGRIILADFPESALEAIGKIPEVTAIRLEKPVQAKMDKARAVSGIDKIHSGLDLPQAYTGKGVICASVDGGFDPNHINFLDENGTPRIGQLTYFRPTQSGEYQQEVRDRDYIPQIDTESDDTYHGTHTLGIMAGSYRGTSKVAVPSSDGLTAETREMANPYYGVAYEADLAVAAGSMNDYFIALGVEDILNYAYKNRKPVALNLSLGSNLGAHDGSSVICQYLDAVAEASDEVNALICVSAGNEGDQKIAMHKTFTATDKSVQTILKPEVMMTNYKNVRYGQVYIYSSDNKPLEIQAIALNKTRNGAIAWRGVLKGSDDGSTSSKYWVSGSDYQQYDTDIIDPQFARWFEGYIGIGTELDKENNRHYAVLDFMCWDNQSGNADGKYTLGFIVKGEEGQRADIFCDGVYNSLSDLGLPGFTDGSTDGTISDVATGKNYITVGSYNTRTEWPSLDGGIYHYEANFPYGKISDFSSYGTLIDGRSLPLVCAPGASVISSSNEYYLKAEGFGDEMRQASVEKNGRTYSWHQSVGTSMATPVVTGAMALWLEADPTLNYKEAMDIIRTTAVKDADVTGHAIPGQWGAGKFDAYAGLKEVLRRAGAGIGNVTADADSRLVIATDGPRRFTASVAGQDSFTATLYSASGAVAGTYRATAGEIGIDASALSAGVYFLKADCVARGARILVK